MFDAWSLSEWIASIGAALFIFGMVTGLSLVLGVVATAVFGKEEEGLVTPEVSQNRTMGTRRAA